MQRILGPAFQGSGKRRPRARIAGVPVAASFRSRSITEGRSTGTRLTKSAGAARAAAGAAVKLGRYRAHDADA